MTSKDGVVISVPLHSSQQCLPHGFLGTLDAVADVARRVAEMAFQGGLGWVFGCDWPAFAVEKNCGFQVPRILDGCLRYFEQLASEFFVCPVEEYPFRARSGIRDQFERAFVCVAIHARLLSFHPTALPAHDRALIGALGIARQPFHALPETDLIKVASRIELFRKQQLEDFNLDFRFNVYKNVVGEAAAVLEDDRVDTPSEFLDQPRI